MGFAEERQKHAGDEGCYAFIKYHLRKCISAHYTCGAHRGLPLLPDRVIWLKADNASDIQLLEPNKVRARYITLSYCWGPVSPDTYLTDASTLELRKMGMLFEDMPPLFQDVIVIARKLGIEYLWYGFNE
jgi:hypothetical protein